MNLNFDTFTIKKVFPYALKIVIEIEFAFLELTAVEKQKSGVWKGGFYRTLLNDIVGDNNAMKTEEKDIKQEVHELIFRNYLRNIILNSYLS